ncbi:MAG: TRAP transporter large permease subunit [Flavobacteriaceae bacterium]
MGCNIALLIAGAFIDMTPAAHIFTPIFLPVAAALGMHPAQFFMNIVLNLCIGICTPPMGTLLFVGSGVAEVTVTGVVKPLQPPLGAMTFDLFPITYFPELSLWLPHALGLID